MKNAAQARRKPVLEEVEPRILYSADFSPGLLAAAPSLLGVEHRTLDAGGEFAAQQKSTQSTPQQQATRHEVVFVDTATPDYQKLVDDIRAQSGGGHKLDVVVLDPNVGGIKQISATLAGMKDVSAVHIIGHGADGQIELGGDTLNFDSLVKNAVQIKGWSQALTADADLLIYGCDVAQHADGKALVDVLSRLTGADVAASEDITGAADKGGNWTLEYQTGGIATPLAISTAEQFSYSGTLATFTVTSTADTAAAGTLRWAIGQANGAAGADIVNFNIGGGGVHTINLTSALPSITGTVAINGTTQGGFAGTPLIELSGTFAGAGATGLTLTGAASSNSTIKGLAINSFSARGIQILSGSTNNVISGNYLGTNAAGTLAMGNLVGIWVATDGNTVGGLTAADRNVISGNTVDGIQMVAATNTVVEGNYIGLNAAGTAALANTNQGVAIFGSSTNNTIGGTAAGAGNLIAGNAGSGLRIDDAGSTGNAILGNAIYGNANLGIDLNKDGVTANDAGDGDGGANRSQNYPVLTSAVTTGAQVTITGTLNSTASRTFRIEFFASVTADASAHGEADRYLGFVNVTTPGSGNIAINRTLLSTVVAVGEAITATATDLTTNDTSEFSVNVVASNTAPVLSGANSLTPINEDPALNAGTLISALIAGKIADPDSGALSGVAVTAVVNTNGVWQYSTNGGGIWNAFGAPSAASARLLAADANTLVRFVPNANWNGMVASGITLRAWDQTSGAAGSTANTSPNGGSTAYSTATASASITINSVNDAPAGATKTIATLEDVAYTFGAVDFGFSDSSDSPANALLAVKITTVPAAGSLKNNGTTVTAGQFVSLVDINSGKLVFTPTVNANGTGYASFTFQVQDSGGTSNSGVDLDSTARTMTINVTSVNDAPQGTNTTVTTLEDTAHTFVTADFGFSDTSDIAAANTLLAVKITTIPGAGTFTDNAVAVAAGQFVSLSDINTGKLTFTPAANANGVGYASFTFQVEDNGGTVGGGVNLDPIPRTMAINVTPVNDAPVLSGADDLSAISENPVGNGGTLVSALLSGQVGDVDAGAATGIAVTAVDNTNGIWQYSINGGSSWTDFTGLGPSSAVLLAADAMTYVRFVPGLNFNGTVSNGITFRAWDQTSGTAGNTANTTTNGGSTAFSAATVSAGITVNLVGLPTAANDAYSLNEDGTLTVDWWNTGWTKRSVLTLSGNVGAQGLTDFPVLVTLNSGNFNYAAAKGDGSDLRFFDANGAALAYEIEDWNVSGTSHVWVKMSQVDANSTQQVQMYYGNSAAADGQNAAAVWSGNGFQAVYHLSDSGSAIGDATANGFDGTAINGPTSDAGEIGGALNFDGVNQYVNLGTNLPLINSAASVTLSAWVNSSTVGNETILAISRANAGVSTGNSRAQIILVGANVQVVARSTDGDLDAATVGTINAPVTAGMWHYVTGVIDYQAKSIKIYIDGIEDTQTSGAVNFTNPTTPSVNSEDAAVGANDDGGSAYFDGLIDEARISNVGRSAAWIRAEYLTMTNAFLSVGAAQTPPTTGGVLVNDTAPSSVNFSASLVSGPAHDLSFMLNADGTFAYTPNANFAGTDTFTYTIFDGINTSNAATVTITVNPVNDAPTGTDHTVTTLEDAPYTFSIVDFGFSDPDDSPANNLLAVQIVTLPSAGGLTDDGMPVSAGQFVNLADIGGGKLVFTPAADANGAGYTSFAFQVQDDGTMANGGVDLDPTVRTMTIGVTAVNDAPVLSGSTNLAAIDEGAAGSAGTLVSALIAGQVSDIDAGSLSGIAVTAVDGSNGAWQYSTDVGVTWVSIGSPSPSAALLLNADANTYVRFVPAANWNGTVSNGITFRAWDQTSGTAESTADTTTNGGTSAFSTATASASITVNSVNDAPDGADNTVTTLEDTPYTFTAADFGFSDAADAPANNLLAVEITTLPGAGTLTANGGAVTAAQFVDLSDISSGMLVFTPGTNAQGGNYASFTFQVQDDGGVANSGVDLDQTPKTIAIDVTAVNDAPAGTDNTVTTLEDTAYTFAAVDFGFTDPSDSPANTPRAVRISTVPVAGTLTDNGVAVTAGQDVTLGDISTGMLVFTPGANAHATSYASFTFQVRDDGSTANGGVDLDQSPNTMSIDVAVVNDAPTGTNNTITTLEDTAYTFAAVDFGFSDPVSSPANSLLAVEITTLPGAGTLTDNGVAVTAGQFVTAVDIAGSKLMFTPMANANGVGYASFTFQVQDDGGIANAGMDLDPIARVLDINVTPVNDAPAGTDRTVTTPEDSDYVFSASAFGFTDAGDAPSDAFFAVRITSLSSAGSLLLSGAAVSAGQMISVANINAGNLVFTPAPNANGAGYASFTFQVEDGGGIANGGVDTDPTARTLSIDVDAVDDAPMLGNNALSVRQGGSVILSGANLSAADIDTPAAGLIFTLSNVLDGQFELVSSRGVATTSFTQANVNAGQVLFVQDGSVNSPAYDVMVSDGTLSAGPRAANVGFSLVPTGAAGGGLLVAPFVPAAPPAASSNALPPAPAPAPAPVVVTKAPPPSAPGAAVVFSGGRVLAAETPRVELPGAIRAFRGGQTTDVPRAIVNAAPTFQPSEMMLLTQAADATSMQFGSGALHEWSAQSAFPVDAHEAERDQIKIMMESVEMGGMALSVGVVWWASRITGLISSLIASMPAWSQLDPLHIVGRDREEEELDEAQDPDADADELAVAMVLEGTQARAGA